MTGSTDRNTFYFYRGRVALYALLRSLELKPGDEVLLQAFTCSAVPSPIVGLSLRPVYLDISRTFYNLDPRQFEARVTERAKVVIVQHTFGIPAEMDAIIAVARKHDLRIIEDCCHVLGSTYRGAELGCMGDAAFYSHEWGKPIVAGLGGVAVVHAEDLLQKVESLYRTFVYPRRTVALTLGLQYCAHSMFRRPALYWVVRDIYRLLTKKGLLVGNFRSDEFQGILNSEFQRRMGKSLVTRLKGKLRQADQMIAHRKWVAEQYRKGLLELGITPVPLPSGCEVVFLRYPLLVRDKGLVLREARRRRVELGDLFVSPVHPLTEDQWRSAGYKKGSCPMAEEVSRHVVSLPIYEEVQRAEVERNLEFVREMRDRDQIIPAEKDSSDRAGKVAC